MIHNLLIDLAREVGAIIPEARAPIHFHLHEGEPISAYAWTDPIPRAGAFNITFNELAILRDFPRGYLQPAVVSLALHEMAHVLAFIGDPVSSEQLDVIETAEHSKQFFHGPGYSRLAAHVGLRGTSCGLPVDPNILLWGCSPSVRNARAYIDGIRAEQGTDLLRLPSEPPRQFLDAWLADLRAEQPQRMARAAQAAEDLAEEKRCGDIAMDVLMSMHCPKPKPKASERPALEATRTRNRVTPFWPSLPATMCGCGFAGAFKHRFSTMGV